MTAHAFGELGIQTSHGRPRISNDNPHSENQFKTLLHQGASLKLFGASSIHPQILRPLLLLLHSAISTPENPTPRRTLRLDAGSASRGTPARSGDWEQPAIASNLDAPKDAAVTKKCCCFNFLPDSPPLQFLLH